ncbi:MAG: hypothetical protein ACK53C_00710 [Pseudomonadota bacterium]
MPRAPLGTTAFATWGVDLSGKDLAVRPGNGLYLPAAERVRIG